MVDYSTFEDLLCRVRLGDSDAAAKLVKDYERAIRVAVRTRLSDPSLRRQFDSIDVCQSVLGSFFLRAASGQYDLHQPAQLVALLVKMAENKLRMRIRASRRQCRDERRTVELRDDISSERNGGGREHEFNGREMLDRATQLMSADVREIARRRSSGEAWGQIASALGGTADGRRKQFERAMSRIAKLLNVD